MRFGSVAIVGRSNVGKSTFLNAVLGRPLAIVSSTAQTTRDALLGVADHGDAQIAFYDTPGLHRPRSELGRRMNATALGTARGTDVLLFLTDADPSRRSKEVLPAEDRDLLGRTLPSAPCVVAINKIDQLRDKQRLLPMIAELVAARPDATVVPMSALRRDGLDRVLDELCARLPEGPHGYDADTLTDRGARFFVREHVRERVLELTHREVPHATAIEVEELTESARSVTARVVIHVEKAGQRGVLVGKGGARLGEIREGAQRRFRELFERPLRLQVHVKVSPRWKDTARRLAELGYEGGDDDGSPLPGGGVRKGPR